MGQRGDMDGLMKAWEKAEGDSIRIAVIDAFAENAEDPRGRALIIRQATSGASRSVRLEAVRALGRHQGVEVVEALILALADSYPSVREAARSFLSQKGSAAYQPLLTAAVSNPNNLVRSCAVRLLTTAALAQAAVRPQVAELLEGCARRDDAPKVREVAVNGLGKLGVSAARKLLVELKRTDADAGVRMAAERAISKLGQPTKELKVIVAVLPLKNDTGQKDPEISRLGTQIADYVTARLSASRLCQVVDRAKIKQALAEMKKIGILLYDGDAPNAPELGRFKMANQFVYGAIQRQGLVYTIVLNRMDVSTLKLIPGAAATATGYRADLEQLKVKVTDRFVANFQ
jgi:HEAT repeat protein